MPKLPPMHKPSRTARRRSYTSQSNQRPGGRITSLAWWGKLRKECLRRNPYCVVCGRLADMADHIIPRKHGGKDVIENLQSMCKHPCHQIKTNRGE